MITVAKDGSGDFTKVQDAINSIPKENTQPITIFIKSGTYTELLTIDRPYLTLEGEEVTSTILTFHNYANMLMEDGMKRGTFRSQSVFIDTHDFTAKNITFENSAGLGREVGQALAVYIDGDCIYFENCHFLGDQDTIFTGPLPPTVIQKNGFVGPKEFAPRINGRHLYRNGQSKDILRLPLLQRDKNMAMYFLNVALLLTARQILFILGDHGVILLKQS